MAQDREDLPVDPTLERPEADLAEQRQPVDETSLTDDLGVDGTETVPGLSVGDEEADEADLLDQATPAAGADEDDYPHGAELPELP